MRNMFFALVWILLLFPGTGLAEDAWNIQHLDKVPKAYQGTWALYYHIIDDKQPQRVRPPKQVFTVDEDSIYFLEAKESYKIVKILLFTGFDGTAKLLLRFETGEAITAFSAPDVFKDLLVCELKEKGGLTRLKGLFAVTN